MTKRSYTAFLLLIGLILMAYYNFADAACLYRIDSGAVPFSRLLYFDPRTAWVCWLPVVPLAFLSIGEKYPDRWAWIAAVLFLVAAGRSMGDAISDQYACATAGTAAAMILLVLIPIALTLMIVTFAVRFFVNSRQ